MAKRKECSINEQFGAGTPAGDPVAAARAEGYAQGVREAAEILSSLSSYLGAGLGDENTTLDDFHDRIRWGLDYQINATVQRCADVVEKMSKSAYSGKSASWGELKAAILALLDTDTPAPPSPEAVVKAALEWAAKDCNRTAYGKGYLITDEIELGCMRCRDELSAAASDPATLAQIIAQAGKGAGE